MGSKTFKDLQAKWYRKIKENGFQDIEKNEEIVRFHGQDFQTQYTPAQFTEKERYFQEAYSLLESDIFLNDLERRIWQLHCVGLSIRKIVVELNREGFKIKSNPSEKDTVNKIINEFKGLMFK